MLSAWHLVVPDGETFVRVFRKCEVRELGEDVEDVGRVCRRSGERVVGVTVVGSVLYRTGGSG